ncbi:hypothetical protein ACP4OV_012281 [Aristida adscensionis]
MASPSCPRRKRARLAPAASNGGVLSADELQEVLLRLPSKPLGRLRAICHEWRSLISSPHFVAAHASRRPPDSLVVAAVVDPADSRRVDVKLLDMASGAVVAHLDGLRGGHFAACGDLLCHVGPRGDGGVRVVNPATGAVTELPGFAQTSSAYVLGHVPRTGEYKVLHIHSINNKPEQSCAVLTLDGGELRWRPVQSPPMRVETTISRNRVVSQGVAHFLSPHLVECDSITSFDLDKEEWRPTLIRGPLSDEGRHRYREHLSLVELNGYLVMVHHNYRERSMDIYFMSDPEKGTWSRTNSVCFASILRGWETKQELRVGGTVEVSRDQEHVARPLMVLEDGSVAFWVGYPSGALRVYDPATGACKDVAQLGPATSIAGLYTGSLLALVENSPLASASLAIMNSQVAI